MVINIPRQPITSIIAASPAFAAAHADAVARLARMEQLEAHARSMECRKQ